MGAISLKGAAFEATLQIQPSLYFFIPYMDFKLYYKEPVDTVHYG
jgi:hypothetical protein